MKFNIVLMSVATFHRGTDLNDPIFNDFAAQIWLIIAKSGIMLILWIMSHWHRSATLEILQEKVQRIQIVRSWWPIYVTQAKDNSTLKSFMQNFYNSTRCITLQRCVVGLTRSQRSYCPIQTKRNRPSVLFIVDSNCLTNVVFKKVRNNNANNQTITFSGALQPGELRVDWHRRICVNLVC